MTKAEGELAAALAIAGVSEDVAARLAAYGALLLEANRGVNLTAARDAEALLPHLLDALSLADDVGETLADVGSGGGLPGIPLAIAAGARVVLIEAIAKKAAFLARALATLGLPGEVVAERAEAAGRDPRFRESCASATARAVGAASAVAELTLPFVRVGGCALLQRGALDAAERQAVADAAPMLGAEVSEERPVGGERRILLLRKTAPTPARFPRRAGIPEKRPLCWSPPRRV